MLKNRLRVILLSSAAIFGPALILATEPASAQEAPIESTDRLDEANEEASLVINKVTVTARRREESDIDVPVAISTVTGNQIDERGLADLGAIAQQVPELKVHTGTVSFGGGLTLRGVSSAQNTAAIDQAVTISFDDIPISYAGIIRLGQFDLAQVEVLKGPQALFFGKNASAGIISLRSAEPTDEPEVMLRVGYESEAAQYSTEGFISGPISDRITGRIAARYSNMDGWIDNNVPAGTAWTGAAPIFRPTEDKSPGMEEFLIRGALNIDLSSDLNLRLRANHAEMEGQTASVAQRYFCSLGVPRAPDGMPFINGPTDCTLDNKTAHGNLNPALNLIDPRFPKDGAPYTRTDQNLYSAKLSYDLSSTLALTSTTGYYDLSFDSADHVGYGPIAAVAYATTLSKTTLSQEFNIASNFAGPFDFMLGVFLQDDEHVERQNTTNVAALIAPDHTYVLKNETISPYLQTSFDITEKLILSGGVRYTHESKTQEIPEFARILYNNKITFNDLSPEVTLAYRPAENLNFYASYRQGYKSGGFQAEHVTLPNRFGAGLETENAFGAETVEGYEIGAKANLLDGRLKLGAAAYDFEYQGLQLARFDVRTTATILQSIGVSSTKGFEFDFHYLPPLHGLTLHGAAAYNESVYDEYGAPCYAGQTVATGCVPNFVAPGVNGFDAAGRQLPRAPEWAGSFGAEYERPISDSLNLRVSSQLEYSDSYEISADLLPDSRSPAFVTIDAGAAISSSDNRWEVAFIGRNLTEEWYPSVGGQTPGSIAPGSRADIFSTVNRGRELLFRLTYRPLAD